MKVYKLIQIDMETMEVEKEISYEYNGPVALCIERGGSSKCVPRGQSLRALGLGSGQINPGTGDD